VALLAATGTADAHVALDPERVQQVLHDIATHHAAIGSGTQATEVEAAFQLGEAVDTLVDMLNQDMIAHGQTNVLGDAILKQLAAHAIAVTYVPRERRYVYDLAAYRLYLRRASAGPRAADAHVRVIAQTFRDTLGPDPAVLANTDVSALLRAIGAEEAFLRDYPGHQKTAEVQFFLAVDYYRAFRNAGDPAHARQYRLKARQALERVTRSGNAFEARAAETLLEQLAAADRR
jgi:hypothetical protein